MKNPATPISAPCSTRRKFALISLLALLPFSAFAATFYISPTGSDSNAGTLSAPFKSITKAQSVASSGDTVSIRGGTYSTFTVAGSDSTYDFVHHMTKSGITYAAYTGETPVFNFASVATTKRVAAFRVGPGVSVTFRGFHVTGVPVGTQKQSECFRIQGNATFDRVICRDNKANGFYFTSGGTGSCTNCDSYNNVGGTALADENTDGFGAHGGVVTFTNCRAWNCSDDGYDCLSSDGRVTFDRCWAYNMNQPGNGNGFKSGGYGEPPATVPSHIVKYCLAANNKAAGFYANHHPGKAADWTSNTSYNNHPNYNMLERVSTSDATDIPGTREIMHENIAYVGTTITNSNLPAANITNNSWTKSGVTVSSADFQSEDATQMDNTRPSSGALPTITFMQLASGSDLAGLGCFASAPATPDTYQSESATAAGGVVVESNYGGYNGTGFTNHPTTGGTLTFSNVDGNGGGTKSLVIRFSNGGATARTGTISINGGTASSISFASTGGWSNWTTMTVSITLNNNSTNTIRFASNGGDLGNIDEITVP